MQKTLFVENTAVFLADTDAAAVLSDTGNKVHKPIMSKALQPTDPLYKLVLPFGGNQLKKTLQGLGTVSAGKQMSSTGKTSLYKIKKTPGNYVRGAIFGKSALPEAQKYYAKLDAQATAPKKKKFTFSL